MTEQVRTAKRPRFSGGIVAIKVGDTGEEQKTFGIHEDVIKQTSPFFRAALDRKWKEGLVNEIELPEDCPEVVSCYIDWCYSKEVASQEPETTVDSGTRPIRREHKFLAQLYVFGEKAQDDAFCDAVITAMTEAIDQDIYDPLEPTNLTTEFPGPDSIAILYSGTPPGSPARRFVVDMHVRYADKSWFEGCRYMYLEMPEFLLDLAMAQLPAPQLREFEDTVRERRKEWFKQKKHG